VRRRLTKPEREQVEAWLLENDRRLYADRVPLTGLGLVASAGLGFKVPNRTARAILWRMRFRGVIKFYNGRSDAVFSLQGARA
jgi:hypothetical protein